jgi:drug/metabolite transporter (DMT)-like permease
MQQSQKNLRGIIAMSIAMLAFSASDACMKIARVELGTGQALFVRSGVALLILGVVLSALRAGPDLRYAFNRYALIRAGIETSVALTFIAALSAMALADITSIILLSPLMITAVSTLFLGVSVGWRRWSAVAVGFIGVLLVVQPGASPAPLWAIGLAFLSVSLVVARDVFTRSMPRAVPTLILTLTTTLATFVGGLILMLTVEHWTMPSSRAMMALGFAAILVLIGNYGIIAANREADISVVAPFRYTILFGAVTLGIVVFGEIPGPIAIFGLVLIVASGLYTLHRERIRHQQDRLRNDSA